jgi:hypothetical protein
MLPPVDSVRLPDLQRKTTNTSTMAAAAGNGPLAPHMLSKFPLRRVGSIGDDSPSKQICFSPAMIQSKSYKMLRWCGNDDMNLASPSECFGDLYRLIAGETHNCFTGTSYPIDPTQRSGISDNICSARGPFPAAPAMVMSVLLVVGRWSSVLTSTQILHTNRNSMK